MKCIKPRYINQHLIEVKMDMLAISSVDFKTLK
jgi:hypothetical protein